MCISICLIPNHNNGFAGDFTSLDCVDHKLPTFSIFFLLLIKYFPINIFFSEKFSFNIMMLIFFVFCFMSNITFIFLIVSSVYFFFT